MKIGRISIYVVLIMVGFCLSMLPVTANAAYYDCTECTITRIGMYPGQFGTTDGFMVQVSDADGQWTGSRTFYLDDSLGKAGYATVLTAYSMGKTLWLRLVDTTPGSLVTIVHINN